MCLYPKLIKNPKYKKSKKNGGIIPPLTDKRVAYVPIGCGKCIECNKKKQREWQVRLTEEIKHNKNGKFVTLTFSDESLMELGEGIELKGYELDNEIATKAVRRFLERWRKKHKKSVKHWLVTELGTTRTERLHLHGVIWTNEDSQEILERWKYGGIWVGKYVNERTINYIVKYVSKADKEHKEYKSKILTSAGIGSGYAEGKNSKKNKYNEEKTIETYTTNKGLKIGLPIYYRNKIYTEEEREKLWIEKLDKNVRWICGEKIDMNKEGAEEEYYKLLEYHRKRNKQLGYGDDAVNWDRKRYENERRNLKKLERIKKAVRQRG